MAEFSEPEAEAVPEHHPDVPPPTGGEPAADEMEYEPPPEILMLMIPGPNVTLTMSVLSMLGAEPFAPSRNRMIRRLSHGMLKVRPSPL